MTHLTVNDDRTSISYIWRASSGQYTGARRCPQAAPPTVYGVFWSRIVLLAVTVATSRSMTTAVRPPAVSDRRRLKLHRQANRYEIGAAAPGRCSRRCRILDRAVCSSRQSDCSHFIDHVLRSSSAHLLQLQVQTGALVERASRSHSVDADCAEIRARALCVGYSGLRFLETWRGDRRAA